MVIMQQSGTSLLLIKSTKKIDNSDMSEDEKEQARDNLNRRIKQSEIINTVSTLGAGLLGQAIGRGTQGGGAALPLVIPLPSARHGVLSGKEAGGAYGYGLQQCERDYRQTGGTAA